MEPPAAKTGARLWRKAVGAVAIITRDRILTEAAGVTFYVVLALFPGLASLISIYGLIADPGTVYAHLDALRGVMPEGGMTIIADQVKALVSNPPGTLGLGLVIGLVTSLWSANAGVKAIIDALNIAFHVPERRSYLRLTMVAFAFTLGMIAFLIATLVSFVVIPLALNFVGLGGASAVLLSVGRWPVMIVATSIMLELFYRHGACRPRARWHWITRGSAFGAVAWLAVSQGFSYYVANFGSYNKTYGSLGAAVGFMTWIWISAIVVLLGAEINAAREHG